MILLKPSFQILGEVRGAYILHNIEAAGRTCYKSEDKICTDSAAKFVKNIIARGHESVLEHQSLSVRVVCDRGVSHELVRHRIASYSQESTRYCNYAGGVAFIIPPWCNIDEGDYNNSRLSPGLTGVELAWFGLCNSAESTYIYLINSGWSPQQARSVLPNSLKTEIVITQNLRQWRHFFNLRAAGIAGKPHPQMLEITIPMLREFKKVIPIVFDGIEVR